MRPERLPERALHGVGVDRDQRPVGWARHRPGRRRGPSAGTPNWTLCGPGGTGCTGPAGAPGVDQFASVIFPPPLGTTRVDLTKTPQADLSFGAAGAAAANQAASEENDVTGPTTSTNTSLSFSTSINWTAVP